MTGEAPLCFGLEEGAIKRHGAIASIELSHAGQRSRRAVADALLDAAPFVRVVGDAVRPANICTAVYEAYHAALDI